MTGDGSVIIDLSNIVQNKQYLIGTDLLTTLSPYNASIPLCDKNMHYTKPPE